ncbi:hypothetical protein ACJX0J_039550 [Zea mays]
MEEMDNLKRTIEEIKANRDLAENDKLQLEVLTAHTSVREGRSLLCDIVLSHFLCMLVSHKPKVVVITPEHIFKIYVGKKHNNSSMYKSLLQLAVDVPRIDFLSQHSQSNIMMFSRSEVYPQMIWMIDLLEPCMQTQFLQIH